MNFRKVLRNFDRRAVIGILPMAIPIIEARKQRYSLTVSDRAGKKRGRPLWFSSLQGFSVVDAIVAIITHADCRVEQCL